MPPPQSRVLLRLPPPGRTFDVVGIGENSWDTIATVPHWPLPNEKLELSGLVSLPGGQTASALVGCARLGCKTKYLGVFGDDEPGRLVESALRSEGVDTSACLTARAPNRSAFIVVTPDDGTRAVMWRRDQALGWPDVSTIDEHIAEGRVLLVDTTDLDAATAAADAARGAGVPVVVDVDRGGPGLDRLLSHVDVLITSEDFPAAFTGAATLDAGMAGLSSRYPSALVVATLGAAGAVSHHMGVTTWSGAYEIEVVDPTGAGDAFRAGFIAAWLQGAASLQEILDFANATAALKCRNPGAQAGLPSAAQVQALLTDRDVRRSNSAGSGE